MSCKGSSSTFFFAVHQRLDSEQKRVKKWSSKNKKHLQKKETEKKVKNMGRKNQKLLWSGTEPKKCLLPLLQLFFSVTLWRGDVTGIFLVIFVWVCFFFFLGTSHQPLPSLLFLFWAWWCETYYRKKKVVGGVCEVRQGSYLAQKALSTLLSSRRLTKPWVTNPGCPIEFFFVAQNDGRNIMVRLRVSICHDRYFDFSAELLKFQLNLRGTMVLLCVAIMIRWSSIIFNFLIWICLLNSKSMFQACGAQNSKWNVQSTQSEKVGVTVTPTFFFWCIKKSQFWYSSSFQTLENYYFDKWK